MWQVGKRNKDLSQKAPHVSERPHMFQKGPICFKRTPYVWKRDPYVAHMLCFLKDFLPHMLKKLHMLQTRSPYVAHMQPICGPYVSAAVVGGSPVILWISLGGKPKWLPLKFGYHDVMRTSPLQALLAFFYFWLLSKHVLETNSGDVTCTSLQTYEEIKVPAVLQI